ncbi:MAG: class I SAM-dependent methyltransferase [Bacteroidales bacterium]|jgi:ubiquinone/menaquinone biosynthesis C-methylase UbiE|nr:class I SAM-dependent methyltransferase [Bacteroidales bacterium]
MGNPNAEFDLMSENLDELVKKGLGIFAVYRDSILSYKLDYIKHIVNKIPSSILDYGCGSGLYTSYMKNYFQSAKIYGCDVSNKSIEVAKANHPDCEFITISEVNDLNVYKDKIDCIFINCVMHHIEPEEHSKWLTGLYNTMKSGSYLIIFEMNMLNPLVRWFVKRTPIDDNATMLKALYCKKLIKSIFGEDGEIKLRYTYLFPWRNKFFTKIEYLFSRLPLGAQYYVAVKKK